MNNEYELVGDFLKNTEYDNKIDVVGREEIMRDIISIISSGFGENNLSSGFGENNPLLIGHPGVGKTAIIEGLAKIFSQNKNVPEYLKGKKIYQLSIINLVAGAKYQGELEGRIKNLISFIKSTKHILFIDEMHLVFSFANKNIDLYNSLKPVLTNNDFCCIGATTFDEYKKHIELDKAFSRRFKKVQIDELDDKNTEHILKYNSKKFENFYFLKINGDDVISYIVDISKQYLPGYLPAKAISLLVETCGRMRSEMYYEHNDILEQRKKIQSIREAKSFISSGLINKRHEIDNFSKEESEIIIDYEIGKEEKKLNHLLNLDLEEKEKIKKLRDYKRRLLDLTNRLKKQKNVLFDYNLSAETYYEIISVEEKIGIIEDEIKKNIFNIYFINKKDIAFTVSKRQKLSVDKLLMNNENKMLFLPLKLKEKIKGQDEAIELLSNSIIRCNAGIRDNDRPLASFLFVGPTGVGKTELALSISKQLFGKNSFLRLDMTEYSEDHSISRILGSPPGYVAFGDRSHFDFIKERGNSLILLDEIEKCSQNVLNVFLQILDYGKTTLADGTEVSFKNTMIIMTTNLGYEIYEDNKGRDKLEIEEELSNELRSYFRPEFLNRFDEIIFFNTLEKNNIFEIIMNELFFLFNRVKETRGIIIKKCDDEKIIEKIYNSSYSYSYGARSIRRYIEKEIGNVIAKKVISGYFDYNLEYFLTFDEKKDKFDFFSNSSSNHLY